ncbi:MAG: ABC transporter permease [Planctomycetota bacterium]|nr:ABC transporter permease [Planctomycetota bacterium]
MRKILTIAAREYRAMVATRGFLFSIVMMPVLMLGSLFAMELMKQVSETKNRNIAVIDHSGFLFEDLQTAANQRNQLVDEAMLSAATNDAQPEIPGVIPERFLLEKVELAPITDDVRISLSDRVVQQQLYAFIEIPADILDTGMTSDNKVMFYSQDSNLSLARNWFADTLSDIVRQRREKESGIPEETLQRIKETDQRVPIVGQGLITRNQEGEVETAAEKEILEAVFLPLGIMLLMFMVIFMASQPMLESVLEEKSQRIAEVLLGSASPFQLMMGKLIGTVGGSLTIFAIYLAGGYSLAAYRGWTALIPFELIPWFLVFQVAGVFFYASIFLAVGASVSQLKEAQSMLLPVWMLLMLPLFIWFVIVQDPLSRLSVLISLFPPATPTTMLLRLATGQQIPIWQPVLGLVLTTLTTLLIVVLAGRIFRVGILWQGKTPKLGELIKWAVVGS